MTRNPRTFGLIFIAALAISALAASAAQATDADFAADGYPASIALRGEGTLTLNTPAGKFTCEEKGVEPFYSVTGNGTLSTESSSLTIDNLQYHNCHWTILKVPVVMSMNGCDLTLGSGTTTGEGASTGTVAIVGCNSATEGITLTIGTEGKVCHFYTPEQQTSGSVTYQRPEGETEEITGAVNGLSFVMDFAGGTQCEGSTKEPVSKEATATYNFRLAGKNEGGEPTDVTITGT